jgi:hypothetical protein
VLAISRENLEELRCYYAAIIKEQHEMRYSTQLASDTDNFVIRILSACGYGMIRRVALAVGSEDLAETYRNVLRSQAPTPAVAFVDLAIKLEHFARYPISEVEHVLEEVRQNRFCFGILRDLIVNDWITRDVPAESRRQISQQLLIEIGESRKLLSPRKPMG